MKLFPAGQSLSESTGKTLVHFDPVMCSACRVKTRCPVKIGKRVATLTIDEASYRGASRHHQYMENTDYRKRCAIRAGGGGNGEQNGSLSWSQKVKASNVKTKHDCSYSLLPLPVT
ncbi:MAG: hypothetical protein ACUBOA_08270 [Candidatus Loosdrechtia sp.]|uniref:hypothetical protein n=1 Tax=Candidatus Loosdrechtia sp. TaxID=3101272 RepID=UPI003A782403|nr:MAG: hypothetical protein QY305_06205 [Candidatus Jettenia sp. AMX2]